jgi:sec-independent protein translocase protein TatB
MLFDIGWPELLLIGVIALVVIGPKDLPRAMRVAGFWMRKARSLSREFQNSVDQMIREAELEDVRQELQQASQLNLDHEIHNTIDPTGELTQSIKPADIPDHFEETPFLPGMAETAGEPPAEAVAALPAPEEVMPEQPLLPFDELEHAPAGEAASEAVSEAQPAPDGMRPPQP